jgi:hypothetical protein
MRKLILLACLALAAPLTFAQAATVPATAQLAWTAPTQATDGSPLTGAQALTKYQVFVSTSPIADAAALTPTAEPGPAVTAYTWQGSVANGATVYARVKACNASGCSSYSAQGSKQIQLASPGAPGTVTITITLALGAP